MPDWAQAVVASPDEGGTRRAGSLSLLLLFLLLLFLLLLMLVVVAVVDVVLARKELGEQAHCGCYLYCVVISSFFLLVLVAVVVVVALRSEEPGWLLFPLRAIVL